MCADRTSRFTRSNPRLLRPDSMQRPQFCHHFANMQDGTRWYRMVPDGTKPPAFKYRMGLYGSRWYGMVRTSTVLKTVEPQGSGGSNPSPSASEIFLY